MTDSLWDFAARCYRATGVAESCLTLQDRDGADINLLLAAAWLAQRGCAWQAVDVAAVIGLCTDWRAHCVLPLRSIRRYLKDTADEVMYQQAKALELDAEVVQLRKVEMALEHLMLSPSTATPVNLLLKHNLTIYIEVANLVGSDLTDVMASLSKALTSEQ
jgi:uncharacterized protein (TIGR02444 family)